jgi:hypothetical protein
MTADPSMRSFLVLDVERSRDRNNLQRQAVRKDLYAVLDGALEGAGIKREEVTVEDRGDGALAVFDRSVLDVLVGVIDGLVKHLAVMNTAKAPPDWLRLRFAVHFGLVHQDPHGWSGAALDETFELNGLLSAKDMLRSADRAQSVLVVSDEVYRQVVCHKYRQLDPSVYRKAEDNGTIGWCMLPGYSAPPLPGSSHGNTAAPPVREPTVAQTHEIPEELVALRQGVDGLAATEVQTEAAYDRAFDKISEPNLPPLATAAPALLDRLDTLERLALGGQPPSAGELGALRGELATATTATHKLRELATGLVDRRDQLRGQLECYHAMAVELDVSEVRDVIERYRVARTLLWTKPCELDAATEAVEAYQQSVVARRDRRG